MLQPEQSSYTAKCIARSVGLRPSRGSACRALQNANESLEEDTTMRLVLGGLSILYRGCYEVLNAVIKAAGYHL